MSLSSAVGLKRWLRGVEMLGELRGTYLLIFFSFFLSVVAYIKDESSLKPNVLKINSCLQQVLQLHLSFVLSLQGFYFIFI